MVRTLTILIVITIAMSMPLGSYADGDGLNDVVKLIEQFYHVKHQSIPLLARATMKAAQTAAKVRGGEYKKLAEAGSIRLAFFEEQTFDSHGQMASFKSELQKTLSTNWSPFVQVLSPISEEQDYIYIRDAGKNFHVLLISIEKRDATVLQVTLTPDKLAQLLKDPEGMAKKLSEEATISDP